jgi:uncharacterized OB-fold protein
VSETNEPAALRGAPREAHEYFERCARDELAVQRCTACGVLRHYPRPHCTACLSPDYEWHTCSGKATVLTFTVVRQNANPRFAPRLPYVVAMVELDEGVHMLSEVSASPESVRVGLPVVVRFDDEPGGLRVPRFVPA